MKPTVFVKVVKSVDLLHFSVWLERRAGFKAKKTFECYYYQHVCHKGYFSGFDYTVKDQAKLREGYTSAFKSIYLETNQALLDLGFAVGETVTFTYSGDCPETTAFQTQLNTVRLLYNEQLGVS